MYVSVAMVMVTDDKRADIALKRAETDEILCCIFLS